MEHETRPLQSKKFIAYILANVLTKAYLFCATYLREGDFVLIVAIICSLFLDVGYILGQASLDKYVRVAKIVSRNDEPGSSEEK